MASPPRDIVTQLLHRLDEGDRRAADELVPLVYGELQRLARRFAKAGGPGQTLQATALVHEAFLKLFDSEGKRAPWDGRRHFFAVAATAMRHLLADYARTANRAKRRGPGERVSISDVPLQADEGASDVEVFELTEALDALEQFDPRVARVVELRFLAGLSVEETAAELGINERSVYRDWRVGRAVLRRQLLGEDET